ncbi:unnamed protein product, partial [marine sediment metagenome]
LLLLKPVFYFITYIKPLVEGMVPVPDFLLALWRTIPKALKIASMIW